MLGRRLAEDVDPFALISSGAGGSKRASWNILAALRPGRDTLRADRPPVPSCTDELASLAPPASARPGLAGPPGSAGRATPRSSPVVGGETIRAPSSPPRSAVAGGSWGLLVHHLPRRPSSWPGPIRQLVEHLPSQTHSTGPAPCTRAGSVARAACYRATHRAHPPAGASPAHARRLPQRHPPRHRGPRRAPAAPRSPARGRPALEPHTRRSPRGDGDQRHLVARMGTPLSDATSRKQPGTAAIRRDPGSRLGSDGPWPCQRLESGDRARSGAAAGGLGPSRDRHRDPPPRSAPRRALGAVASHCGPSSSTSPTREHQAAREQLHAELGAWTSSSITPG